MEYNLEDFIGGILDRFLASLVQFVNEKRFILYQILYLIKCHVADFMLGFRNKFLLVRISNKGVMHTA